MTPEERLSHSLRAFFGASLGDLLAYALFALGVWLFFYVLLRERLRQRRVARHEAALGQVRREILQSLRSILIFGLVSGAVVYAAYSGWTRLYVRTDDHGWLYFFLSIGLMVLMHDTYFYWTHRLMHHPRLFRWVHQTHHRSISPTPWAAYAFSPAEALVQAGIGRVIVFLIPVHPAAFGLFMLWQIGFNVLGHCGYEIFPRWFIRSPAGMVLNSITHHTLHHERFRSNYSLYFNVWDRLLGTNHPEYAERFEAATAASAATQPTGDPSK